MIALTVTDPIWWPIFWALVIGLVVGLLSCGGGRRG